jgi:type I restriction enzyme M protein
MKTRSKKTKSYGASKALTSQQSVNQAIKSICDVMRRSNCAGALQYVPELTWILFLRILDEREQKEEEYSVALGVPLTPSLSSPYRWRDWAAPFEDRIPADQTSANQLQGWKRRELSEGSENAFISFVHTDLLPHLRGLRKNPNASSRQRVISEIMSGVDRTRIDTEKNLLDVLDKVHELSEKRIDDTHVFPLSQVFEGLLLKMGEKGNDGGQFFTPREIIRAMVRVIDPQIGQTVYDPACGTGGFLAQAFEYMAGPDNSRITKPDDLDALKSRTFYGREKDNVVYPIGLANLVLHNIDEPHIWHGNALTGAETYGGLFTNAPPLYDVILMNPPFGGKEGNEAKTNFAYKTGATQVLFLQYVINNLSPGGRCGMVIDEGVLFRTNEDAFTKTKGKLLDECDLWCIVSLPGGVFTAAGAGVKTNLLFFTKGERTQKIWYYDLSDIKVGKKTPLTLRNFEDFFRLLPDTVESQRSWSVNVTERRAAAKRQSDPLRAQAAPFDEQANALRDQIKALKRVKPSDRVKIDALTAEALELAKKAKELLNKAQAIEDGVYDLKAVNPNAISDDDTRTPDELLDIIERKGREVSAALATLRAAVEGKNGATAQAD